MLGVPAGAGPQRKGGAPIGHRRIRIEPRRLLKRPNGFVVIECVDQTNALIEIFLGRFRPGGDFNMVRPEAFEERRG